jgi:hypothetical protein
VHNRRCSEAQPTVHNLVFIMSPLQDVETQCIASLLAGGFASLHRRLCTFHPCGSRKENDKNKNYTDILRFFLSN